MQCSGVCSSLGFFQPKCHYLQLSEAISRERGNQWGILNIGQHPTLSLKTSQLFTLILITSLYPNLILTKNQVSLSDSGNILVSTLNLKNPSIILWFWQYPRFSLWFWQHSIQVFYFDYDNISVSKSDYDLIPVLTLIMKTFIYVTLILTSPSLLLTYVNIQPTPV